MKISSISDLKTDKNNANKGTKRGRGMVESSLRETGAGRSIVVDKDGRVIAGNKTLETWADIANPEDVVIVPTDGKKLVVVQRQDLDLSDDTGLARKLAYYDNRTSQVGLEWDTSELLGSMNAGLDLSFVFEQPELDDLLGDFLNEQESADAEPQIDKAEELRAKWDVQPGQMWRLPSRDGKGEHRLICGDCTDKAVVDRVMRGERADMIFTDPPYNVASEGSNFAATATTQKKTYEAIMNADWDHDFDISRIFPVLMSVMANDCSVYVCTSHWLIAAIWGWMGSWSKFYGYCVWCKPNPAPSLAKRHWTWATELIAYAVQGKHVCNFPENGHALSWWEIVSPSHATPHPTEKPIAIPEKAIGFSCANHAVVFDPFLGSGTTLIACENLSRYCRAVEISPGYVAVALQRYADAFGVQPELID